MTKGVKNLAVSVHQRLLDKARKSSRPFNELLQYFVIERFIYRISKSSYADGFILKGALMFSALSGPLTRPTMDIDLLGKIENEIETITGAMKKACLMAVEADGISFNSETIEAIRLRRMLNTRAYVSAFTETWATHASRYRSILVLVM